MKVDSLKNLIVLYKVALTPLIIRCALCSVRWIINRGLYPKHLYYNYDENYKYKNIKNQYNYVFVLFEIKLL